MAKPNWAGRFNAVEERLPDLDPMQEGFSVPAWVDVGELRKLYCTTLAPDDVAADERIERLARYTDPCEVLAIVAPYVPVTFTAPPVVEAPPDEPDADADETPVEADPLVKRSEVVVTSEVVDVFANTAAEAAKIAKERGGEVKGFD